MALDREAIWQELTIRLRTKIPVRVSRRRKAQWAIEELPVVMVLDDSGDETPTTDRNAPGPVWNLTGEIVVLDRVDDQSDAPTSNLNRLVYDVLVALERATTDPLTGTEGYGYVQTYTNLGGLVRTLDVTKIEKGAVQDLAGQAVARINIEMEAR